MSRRLLVLLVLLLVVAVAAPAAAITKNYVADSVHTYVGLIGFYSLDPDTGQEVWSHRCTGELIADNVVLTAGHCTDNEAGGVMERARIWFQQDAGARFDGVTVLEDPLTGYPNTCAAGTLGSLCAESSLMYNYGFDNFAGFPDIHDVGIVILNQEITGLGKAELPDDGVLDSLRKARGTQDTTFRVSGYGISLSQRLGIHGEYSLSYRVRLQADSKLVNLNAPWNDGFNIQLNGNGDGRGGTCSGDSGGPVFYPADSHTVVAITSFGKLNAGCRGDGYYYRIDRQEVLDWINGGYDD